MSNNSTKNSGRSEKDDISYSEDEVSKMVAVPKLIPGLWYKFKIQYPSSGTNEKSNNYFVKFVCAPLEDYMDNDSERSPTVQNMMTLPIANKKVAGHVAPNTGGLIHSQLRAIYGDDLRGNPVKNDAGEWEDFDGNPLEDFEATEIERKLVAKETLDKIIHLYKTDGDELEGKLFWGEVAENGDFMQIKRWSMTPPDDKKLIATKENFVQRQAKAPKKEEPKKEEAKSEAPVARRRK